MWTWKCFKSSGISVHAMIASTATIMKYQRIGTSHCITILASCLTGFSPFNPPHQSDTITHPFSDNCYSTCILTRTCSTFITIHTTGFFLVLIIDLQNNITKKEEDNNKDIIGGREGKRVQSTLSFDTSC